MLRIDWFEKNKVCQEMFVGVMEVHPMTEDFDFLQPIPLTEAWLINFGFGYDAETRSWSILTSLEKFDYLFEVSNKYQEYFQPDFMGLDIVYVHQLQNLYFALTGEELQ